MAVEQEGIPAAAAEAAAAMAASAPAGAVTAIKRSQKPGSTSISAINSHSLSWKQSFFINVICNL